MSRLQERETVPDVYNLFLAAVLFISPWLFKLTISQGKIDLWVTSAIIGILSLAAIIAYRDWEEWINVLMGVWLIVSPWLLGFAHTRAMHLSIGFGIVIVLLALLDLFLHYEKAHPEETESRQEKAHQ
ncbi:MULTISPECIES: SPW repeat protein [unclassified Bradyrhizobium]|uniref:SPW repeat protein n=1 Tax=unclassified Bradyrhizobium TaxID=2631580 RepID=UPI002479F88C|nr:MULTISPECIES: SPW repeat protein [unclassified Bradyrhizobium]WGR73474.1 SPW repeat protein [Bradyrhizobium sp. ISRA426]WGR78311.1 SPW repeat protein [Bradyrhizobium sp. ISRA430]WGR88712.1 SPW repeat protein [Bradyrhizobium sp. ISRA432]